MNPHDIARFVDGITPQQLEAISANAKPSVAMHELAAHLQEKGVALWWNADRGCIEAKVRA